MAYRTTTTRTLAQSNHNMSYRSIHNTDTDTFKTDILKSDLIRDPQGQLSNLCKQYYHVLKALFNKRAQITTKSVSQKLLKFYNLKGVVFLNECGTNHAPLWMGHVIQNSVTAATHKWLKSIQFIIRIIIMVSTTLKIHVSYGIAINFFT